MRPLAVAVMVVEPAVAPKVTRVLAMPSCPVTAEAGFNVADPAVTANVTVTPATGIPD